MKKDSFIIGRMFTRNKIIFSIVCSILIAAFSSNFLSTILPVNFIVTSIILTFLLMALYVPLMVELDPYYLIKDEYLIYFNAQGFIEKFKFAFSVFNKTKNNFSAKIPLSDISDIHLTWTIAFGYPQLKYYPLKLSLRLKDSTLLTMRLENYENAELIDAFKYLKGKSINIYDKYNLLEAIENPNVNLFEHIDNIEKALSRGTTNES